MIKQFFKKVLISYLIIITFVFAPAVAYADPVTDKIDKLQIDLQKKVGDRWTLSPRNSVGASVNIGGSQSYPVTATTTATTAAGATTTNTATLTAEKIGSKIFTPTTANIVKRFAGGVATSLVAIALYDMLGKAVNYVLDPKNNRVLYAQDGFYYQGELLSNDYETACKIALQRRGQPFHHAAYRANDNTVRHRIDGLEIVRRRKVVNLNVRHRIDGLEIAL